MFTIIAIAAYILVALYLHQWLNEEIPELNPPIVVASSIFWFPIFIVCMVAVLVEIIQGKDDE
jgi:hypothetical protein